MHAAEVDLGSGSGSGWGPGRGRGRNLGLGPGLGVRGWVQSSVRIKVGLGALPRGGC